MEGKKRPSATATATATATAAWCLLAVVLLSGHLQPVAAISAFCRCYKACYAECRKDSGPYPFNFGCLQQCFNGDQRPARPKSAADCDRICLIRVCGVMSTTAVAAAGGGDAQTCLVDCRNSIGQSAAPLKDAGGQRMN